MRLIRKSTGWVRVAALIWTSVWMLAVPLFHVHPEADHRHGEVGHIHGGTVHTVFSQDLSCEFSGYDHTPVAATESPCPLHLIAQPLHGAEHLEISVVLASSAQPQVGKGTALDVAAHSFHANQLTRPDATWQLQPSPSLTHRFLSASLPSRAPPSV